MNFFRRKSFLEATSEPVEAPVVAEETAADPVEAALPAPTMIEEDDEMRTTPEPEAPESDSLEPESPDPQAVLELHDPVDQAPAQEFPEDAPEADEDRLPAADTDEAEVLSEAEDADEALGTDETEEAEETDEADETVDEAVNGDETVITGESDTRSAPNPFEERLARLRQHLQEGPRLVVETPVEPSVETPVETPAGTPAEAAADEVTDPEPASAPDLPEPAAAHLPEPMPERMPEPMPETMADWPSATPSEAPAPEPVAVSAVARLARNAVSFAEAETPPIPIVPEPSPEPVGRRAGRVKTRLLGFERGVSNSIDPLGSAAREDASGRFPVGWIVVVKGPGRGASFCLYNGLSQIGRGGDQAVCLDFGDTSISRENHAVVAYDSEQKKHFLGHGGKANIVRLNDMPVLSTEELSHGDQIRIGETTLRFVALCGADFDWASTATDDDFDAAFI